MSWTLAEKPVSPRITRKLSKEFAEMTSAPHDRPFSERRLEIYKKLYERGLFRPPTWAKALCAANNTIYRVNGKHTSIMFNAMEEPPEFYCTIESYFCDTLEDVAQLYATFDSKTMTRSSGDINMTFAASKPELAVLSASVINHAVPGMDLHFGNGYRDPRLSAADRAENMLDYPEFVVWLANFVGPHHFSNAERKTSRHLMRAGVVGAMFGTWLKAKGPATEFWAAVRDETGIRPSLPDRKLSRFLLTSGVDTGGGSGIHRARQASPRELYVRSIHAWNAWRRNEPTELRYHADKSVPPIR